MDDLVDERLGGEDARVLHHRQALLIAHAIRQAGEFRVGHAVGEQLVAQHHVVGAQRGVDGIQAGGDLHALGAVHRQPVGHEHPGLLQRRPAVGEAVLHHQVLGALGVDEGRDVGVLGGDHRLHGLHAVGLQGVGDVHAGPGGDLVDHGPGEADPLFIGHIRHKALVHVAQLLPDHGGLHHGAAQLLAVAGHVVHAHQRQRVPTGLVAGVEHGGDDAHGSGDLLGSVVHVGLYVAEVASVGVAQGVALLGDGEGGHLEAGMSEHGLHPRPGLGVGGLGLDRLGQRSQHPAVHAAVGVQDHGQGQVVVGCVDLVHHVVVKGLHAGDAPVHQPRPQQPVRDAAHEDAEDVADAEVGPAGVGHGVPGQRLHVIGRQLDTGFGPRGGVLQTLIIELHCNPLLR